MDALALAMWANEITADLTRLAIRETGAHGAWRAGLALSDGRWLTISIERFHPSIFVEPRRPGTPSGGLPAPLAEALVGRRFTGVEALPGNRIVRLALDRGSLIVELLSQPALILLDEAKVVVAAHQNTKKPTSRLRIGADYSGPAAPPNTPYPGLNRRISTAIGVDTGIDWPSIVARGAAMDELMVVSVGSRFVVTPTELAGGEVAAREPTVNAAARAAFLLALRQERHAQRERAFQSRVRSLAGRLKRTHEAIRRDLEKAEAWPHQERCGTALLAHGAAVPPRADEVTLPDPFDPDGATITITVDPRLSPAKNAAVYLKRAARGKRAIETIGSRRERIVEDLAWITPRLGRPESDWEADELTVLRTLIARYRIRTAAPSNKIRRGRAAESTKFHPRRYRSTDGWTILVGRNNDENDWLTHRLAKPDDFWFHAQGVAGAHVVLRREGRKDNPSRRTLEEAAAIAAAFSRGRHSKSVPVIYTLAKYVRKPRKAAPGLAVCTREKTLMVEPADLDEATHADETA